MSDKEKDVASLCFNFDLDLTNARHVKLLDFLQKRLSGNSRHVALQMLLNALPETEDGEAALIIEAVRNKPLRSKRGPSSKTAKVNKPLAISKPEPAEHSLEAHEKKIVDVAENVSKPTVSEEKSDVIPDKKMSIPDVGVGMLGESFGRF